MSAQVVGVVLAAVGAWQLWSPWALILAGALLLVVPELASGGGRR